MKKFCTACAAGLVGAMSWGASIQNGDSVAFMGDSITQQGWGEGGYVRMCESAFKANGIKVKIIPAGISGNKSDNMLARLDKDVISKKPTYMTLSCGVNDVWHQDHNRGITIEDYKKNITAIIDKARAAGIKVIVLTSTMIKEDVDSHQNKKLVVYNDFLREIAKAKNCPLVDLNAEMQKQVADYRAKTGSKDLFLTGDGVHMGFLGNRMMASMILKNGFDFTEAEMEKSLSAFEQINVPVRLYVKGADYLKAAEKAVEQKTTPHKFLQEKLNK